MRLPWLIGLAAAMVLSVGARASETPESLSRKAFEDAQMAASSRAGVAMAQNAARLAAGSPDLLDLVRARQDAEARWRAADAEYVKALGAGDARSQVKAAGLRGVVDAAAAEIAEDDRRLARDFPAFAELTSAAPLPLVDAQALLAPDEALVFILPAPHETFIWALRRDRAGWVRGKMDDAQVTSLVRDLRTALDPQGVRRAGVDAPGRRTTRAPAGFPRAKAYELYRSVWAPAEAGLKGARTVYVVAGGALGSLPLAVLPTARPEGSDADSKALRRTPWLMRRYALATLPSVSSLRVVRRAAALSDGGAPFAGFGDPILGGPDDGASRGVRAFYRGGVADTAVLKSLPRLKGARSELLALAAALGAPRSSVLAGPAATETAVKAANLSDTRVVAFATHGLVAGEIDGLAEPALVLTPPARATDADDGLLTASEAARLKLNADWVVLSACNTAAGDGAGGLALGGEGLSGLARGFFYAGGKALLVSHWRVRDDAAARLTTEAVTAYAHDPAAGRAAALRRAMLKLMNDPRVPGSADPAVWAPFVVVGG